MEKFKHKLTGKVYKFIGTFISDQTGEKCYKTSEWSGWPASEVEETNDDVWPTIRFNCRLRWKEGNDCVEQIQKIGGDGNSTVGGWWFCGSKEMLDKLLKYMGEKGYDLASFQIE